MLWDTTQSGAISAHHECPTLLRRTSQQTTCIILAPMPTWGGSAHRYACADTVRNRGGLEHEFVRLPAMCTYCNRDRSSRQLVDTTARSPIASK